MRANISRSTSNKNICHLIESSGPRYIITSSATVNAALAASANPAAMWRGPRSGCFKHGRSSRTISYVQRFLTQYNIHCKIAITPHPRKPSHVIITDTVNTASRMIASFLPVRADDNRGLVDGFRILASRWRYSFIVVVI